ncbi:cell wall protein DAN4-like [Pomacea canaliculata]|uniref:cell wall protein DAN4-like n=1 Tax=Pomacea canaliculata TaxID=400727 RepID=UPI000D733A7C|nr:cell wall protein DAN4-like [Pomacea canaliculata]XP_025101090.1 cell wall protein DAN4-like [Pomacea canaliculata]
MDTVFPTTSETSTTNNELSTTISEASTTSNKSTTGTRETPATTIETSTTSSTASTSTTNEASTTNEILSTPIEAPVTKVYTVSDTSSQITSPQNSIYSRDSGGGATAGAIAGTVVGIILICVIVAFVFVIYKLRQKRNTCPPSDQTFPDETGVADCVNPVYQPSEAISPSPAVQIPGSSSDLSQGQATGTVLSDEVGQYVGISMTPSTASSNHEIRSKPLKPGRKFLSKSAYIPGSTPETGGDVYAVVDKNRKSNLITDNKEPLSTEKVTDGLYAVVDKTRKSNLITDNKELLSKEKVTDGLYAVPDKFAKPPTGTDQARRLIDENSKHDVPSESLNYSMISDIPYNKANPDRGNKMLSEEVYTEVKKPMKPIKVKPELKPKPDQKVELYAEVKKRHERSDNNSGSSQNKDAHLESNKRKTIW